MTLLRLSAVVKRVRDCPTFMLDAGLVADLTLHFPGQNARLILNPLDFYFSLGYLKTKVMPV
jgi:hypothetical protein